MGPYRIEQNIDGKGWGAATSRTYPDGATLADVKAGLISELEGQGMTKEAEVGNEWTMRFKAQVVKYRIVNSDGSPA